MSKLVLPYEIIKLFDVKDDGTVDTAKNYAFAIQDNFDAIVRYLRGLAIEPTTSYSYNFSYDDNKWTLTDATITGGVLNITTSYGSGKRYPDNDWLSMATDDFKIEVDFKQNSLGSLGAMIRLKLVADGSTLDFSIDGSNNLMRIHYAGEVRTSQTFIDDTNLHTVKIQRRGTVYYFTIDSEPVISWDYGTARTLEHIELEMATCIGDYDNFKYSW